jgi:hypothetical protein
VLSPDGQTLFVATEIGEFVRASDSEWHVEWTPRGVVAIDTTTWNTVGSWEEPIATVAMSPDGRYVVGSGLTRIDSITTTGVTPHPVYVIAVEDLRLHAELEVSTAEHDTISFSPDGSLSYLARWGSVINIVDLASSEVIDTVLGPQEFTYFPQAGVVVTRRYAGS